MLSPETVDARPLDGLPASDVRPAVSRGERPHRGSSSGFGLLVAPLLGTARSSMQHAVPQAHAVIPQRSILRGHETLAVLRTLEAAIKAVVQLAAQTQRSGRLLLARNGESARRDSMSRERKDRCCCTNSDRTMVCLPPFEARRASRFAAGLLFHPADPPLEPHRWPAP